MALNLFLLSLCQTQERRFEEEMKRRDVKIIMELDQKLMDQQSMLEKVIETC